MPFADIEARSSDGRTVLLVEAKSKLRTSAEWAARMRSNLVATFPVSARFFLLATPDRFYFWTDGAGEPRPLPPAVMLDPHAILLPYFERAGIERERLNETSFELVLASWLRDLTRRPPAEAPATYPLQLVETGLFEALYGASLLYQQHW